MDNMGAEKIERRQGLGGENETASIEMIEKMAQGGEFAMPDAEEKTATREELEEQLAQPFLPPEEKLAATDEIKPEPEMNFQRMSGRELAEVGAKLQKQYKDDPAAFLDAIEDIKEQR